METCKNCFSPIKDMRKETRCSSCNAPIHKECAINDSAPFCDVCYTVKTETPERVEFTIPEIIRRTYIETYNSCPYKFLKEVIEGNDQPPTCYTQIGIDLHDLFELATNDRNITIDMMRDSFKAMWDEYTDDLFTMTTREKMWLRSQDSIDTFYQVIETMPIPMTTEEKIIFSIGENMPKVSITMDGILDIDGELEMFDWKTGAVMVGVKLEKDLQAPLYIYAVQQHFKQTVRRFTFYYVNENKTRVFERVNDDEYVCRVGKREYFISLTSAIRKVKDVFSKIVNGDFNIPIDTKKMYFSCKMCHIREQGMCRGADQEVWYQNKPK